LIKNSRQNLEKEISINFSILPSPGLSYLIVSLFIFIAVNNFIGLSPYVFTASRHLVFTASLAFRIWAGLTLIR